MVVQVEGMPQALEEQAQAAGGAHVAEEAGEADGVEGGRGDGRRRARVKVGEQLVKPRAIDEGEDAGDAERVAQGGGLGTQPFCSRLAEKGV